MASTHSPEDFRWFIQEQRSLQALIDRFPEDWVRSDTKLQGLLGTGGVPAVLGAAKNSQAFLDRILNSQMNPEVVKSCLPVLVQSRMMVLALKNYSLAAQTKTVGKIQLDERNAGLLQSLLFDGPGFVRKPVSLVQYALVWPQVTQKSYLMPLVQKKGIYCFYSEELVQALLRLIAGRPCVELGAGDGTLTRFLNEAGGEVRATDNQSWSAFIDYPATVEKLDARAALKKYRPQVALASWPDPENSWEQSVFETPEVELYVVLGSGVPGVTGNPKTYAAQKGFVGESRADLARLLVPDDQKNEVWVFRRKGSEVPPT